MAPKLYSGTAAHSQHTGPTLTGTAYPPCEDPPVPIDQHNHFNAISTTPPTANHDTWDHLHLPPLVLNALPACRDPGTLPLHLTEGGHGFDALGSPSIHMHQMHIAAPMVKAGMTHTWVGLNYKPHGPLTGGIERCATPLRTFFDRCESEIDVAPSQAHFPQKRRGVGPLCCPMSTWICVDYITPCPGVADMVGIHSFKTTTFRMMTALTHFFKERAHVFIPLDSKHPKDD